MHNRHYLIIPYIAIIIFSIIQAYIFSHAVGGVDISVYWSEAGSIKYQPGRYYREILSWGLIEFITKAFNRENILVGVGIAIAAISLISLGARIGLLLFSSLLSPFGLMLELNVLRQCFSTVLICVGCIYFIRNRTKISYVIFALAFFCHNSSFIIISGIIGFDVWARASNLGRFFMLSFFIATGLTLAATGLLSLALNDHGAVIDDGVENAIYLTFCCLYGVALFVSSPGDARARVIALAAPASALVVFILCFLFGMGSWVFGRVAIGGAVLCNFIILYKFLNTNPPKLWTTFMVPILLLFGFSLIALHPGVMSMLFMW